MAFNQLNVVIGAKVDALRKELSLVERDLQRFSRKMSEIGTNLTQAISVPLAGLGTAAVTSFASLEKLTKTLESVMGSSAAAAVELEKLREVAKAPGLGFEQAVTASARLQAVGLNADQARETIKQFANAVARSGGGSEEFDGVTRALGQIAAKGKVYAEEINQINERLFEIRPALKAAFGTSNTEELQKLGISSEEFIAKITQELGKLDRVNGGLANSFENFKDSVKTSLASLGNEINRVLNISGFLDRVATGLSGLAREFSLLDDGTKRFILTFVGVAAAIGPVVLAMGKLASVFSIVVIGAKSLVGALPAVVNFFAGFPGIIGRATAAFTAFSAIVGGTLPALAILGAAVGGIILAYQGLQKRYELATAASRALKEVQSQAIQQTAQEIGQVRRLADVAGDESRSKQDRVRALQQLQQIAPDYFKGLDIETVKTTQLTSASDAYAKSLINRAKVQLAAQKIAEIDAKLIDSQALAEEGRVSVLQSVSNAILSGGNATVFTARQVKSATNNINENVEALKRQRDALEQLLKTSSAANATPAQNPFPTTFSRNPKLSAEENERLEAIKERAKFLKDFGKTFSDFETVTPRVAFNQDDVDNISNLAVKYATLDKTVIGLKETIGSLAVFEADQALFDPSPLELFKASVEGIGLAFNSITEKAIPNMQTALGAGVQAFQQLASQGINNVKDLGRAVLAATAQIVKAFIQQGVAAAIANAFKNPAGIIPPVGLALAAAAGAAAGGLFQGLINRLKVPALAQGGIASGPSLALVGEYPGARTNPEVIAPLDKLKNLIQGGQNFGPIIAETIISGSDLRIVLSRAERGFTRQTTG